MNKNIIRFSLIAALSFGIASCGDDDKKEEGGSNVPACESSCKDANTLSECQSDGSKKDVACPNGCDSSKNACKSDVACENSCKDDNTLSECKSDGSKEDKPCDYGCNRDENKCNDAPACANSCKDDNTLSECQSDGSKEDKPCDFGCNREENTCNLCTVNICKDASTLYECKNDGSATEKTCDGKCLDDDCRAADYCNEDTDCTEGIRTVCKKSIHQCVDAACANKECGKSQTCLQGLCISDANLNAAVGDECDPKSFTDYCLPDNTWMYCILDSDAGGVKTYKVKKKACGGTQCVSYKVDGKDTSSCDLGMNAEQVCGSGDHGSECEEDDGYAFKTTYSCIKSTTGDRIVIMDDYAYCGYDCFELDCL